jgi:hypothetical protein
VIEHEADSDGGAPESDVNDRSASPIRRPLWIWPFIAGAAVAVALIAAIGTTVTVKYSWEEVEQGHADTALSNSCERDQQELLVAVESWYAIRGTGVNPTQANLVSAELLRAEIPAYTLVEDTDGSTTPIPRSGGDCD